MIHDFSWPLNHVHRLMSWCLQMRCFFTFVWGGGADRQPPSSPLGEGTSITHLLTYLLTPWCRFLLEKLTGLQLVTKFPAFHVTRRFITALTSVRHLSLSWASPIQSIYPHPTSWRSIIILSTHLRLGLPSGLLPSGLHTSRNFPGSFIHLPPHRQSPVINSLFIRILPSPRFPFRWHQSGLLHSCSLLLHPPFPILLRF